MTDIKILKGSELIDMGIYKDSNGFLIGSTFIYEANQPVAIVKRLDIEDLKKKLDKLEQRLSKCRTSVMEDGWQTMRYAKKARKWDMLAQEKMEVLKKIDEYEKNYTRI